MKPASTSLPAAEASIPAQAFTAALLDLGPDGQKSIATNMARTDLGPAYGARGAGIRVSR